MTAALKHLGWGLLAVVACHGSAGTSASPVPVVTGVTPAEARVEAGAEGSLDQRAIELGAPVRGIRA